MWGDGGRLRCSRIDRGRPQARPAGAGHSSRPVARRWPAAQAATGGAWAVCRCALRDAAPHRGTARRRTPRGRRPCAASPANRGLYCGESGPRVSWVAAERRRTARVRARPPAHFPAAPPWRHPLGGGRPRPRHRRAVRRGPPTLRSLPGRGCEFLRRGRSAR